MSLIAITVFLILVGIVAYLYGAFRLSKYAFRISSGLGIGVLIFPPLTLWFAIWKLEEEGKELPTALCAFGVVNVAILLTLFWTPLTLAAAGEYNQAIAESDANLPAYVTEPETPPAQAPAAEPAPATEEAVAEEANAEESATETEEAEAAPAENDAQEGAAEVEEGAAE